MTTRVLLVDDDMELLDIARILLQQKNPDLEIVTANSVKEALRKLDKEKIDVVICDYLMPDSTGLDLLEALKSEKDDIGFIIWTGHSREEVVIRALNMGADHYILKSTDYRNQFSTILEIIQDVQQRRDNKEKTSPMIAQEDASQFIHKLFHDITGIAHNIMGYTTLIEEENNPEYTKGISRLVSKLNERIKRAVTEVDDETLVRKS
ncbi:MAG: response regulator [Candidatus Thorarchaeota archaeon]